VNGFLESLHEFQHEEHRTRSMQNSPIRLDRTFLRYIAVSIAMYCYVFLAMYCLVDILAWNKTYSYLAVYVVAYFINYITTLKFVFAKEHAWSKSIKYLLHIAFFLCLGTGLFHLFTALHINYLVATCMVIAILFPLRFLLNKHFVFR
jgi:putative flippase GtrA